MSAGIATISFPARCAVAVVCGDRLLSQVYPAAVPIEAFIDGVLDLLNDDFKRRGESGLEASTAYELQRVNGTRLDVTKTLDELGVEDGATLVLAPAQEGDSFEPRYESLSTGLAQVGRQIFTPVTPQTATATALGILAMVSIVIAALSTYSRVGSQSWMPAVVTIGTGLVIAAGALWVWRWWSDRRDLLTWLCWAAVPLLSAGFAFAAPGEIGAPHLFIAALLTAVLATGVFAFTQRCVAFTAAIATLAVVSGAVAGTAMFTQLRVQWAGMAVLVGMLVLLAIAPTLALQAARIHPPHVGSVTGRDLFRRGDGTPVDTVVPFGVDDDGDAEPDATPTGAAIARAARQANGVLRGICAAAGVMLPVSVWATLNPGGPDEKPAAILALLFVLIYISRARTFTDQIQAAALVLGAATAVCVAAARYVVAGADSSAALIAAALMLFFFAAASLGAALLVPSTRFTPLVRMVVEWLELGAIVAALPLAAWIGGIFTWVRMR